MTKEMEDFRCWTDFQNKKMTKWLAEYFIKKGIPRRLPSVDNIIANPLEQSILEQAERYFSRTEEQAQRQKKLSKMKSSWTQYCRRKTRERKVHTVYVDDKTHTVLKKVKKKYRLDNLGQAVESIIDGAALKREIQRLENANGLLQKKLKDLHILQESNRQKEIQLREMHDKTESLEQRNLMLTKALDQLASSLRSE
ncbi:hypothetical protein VFDL14_06430 [Vibrio fortis]|uniref:Uncharacterized protein n=1 Tax=Vibrio fortis TaxID=212667 RepID=A0A066UTD6_9VIBR|nr:hypothetical protein [Vibrio fortis]KDN30360.1 hypothetical protein VFDL14_06430 [Vibrio fortis]